VRQGADGPPAGLPEPAPAADVALPKKKKRGRLMQLGVAGLVVATLATLGVGAALLWMKQGDREKQLGREAEDAYAGNRFGDAKDRYAELQKKYPDSEDLPKWQFMEELSEVRGLVNEKPEDIGPALEKIVAFAKERQKGPLMQERGPDLGKALVQLLTDYVGRQIGNPNDAVLPILKRGEAALEVVASIKKTRALPKAEREKVEAAFKNYRVALQLSKDRQLVLKRLNAILEERPVYPSFKKVQQLLAESEAVVPGISRSTEAQAAIEKLHELHPASIVPEKGPGKLPLAVREDRLPGLLFAPELGDRRAPVRGDGRLVLALVRGTLCALDQASGRPQWAVRVGLDTTSLPVRVRARDGSLERFLVVSSDSLTLTAYDPSGSPLWPRRFARPVVGRPLVLDQRALVATEDGVVYEVELFQGRVLNRYNLGQRLTVGGAFDPVSRLAYFPAAEECIYVLNVDERRCVLVHHAQHPPGSLRFEPLVVRPPTPRGVGGKGGQAFLLLTQADGLRASRLRLFDLPLAGRDAAERTVTPEPRLDGWPSFRPYVDSEKVVLLSDTGDLKLFGLPLPGTTDRPLFPLLGNDRAARRALGWDGLPRQRAQLVQGRDPDLWLLLGGRLQRLRMVWTSESGPQLERVWGDPPAEPGPPAPWELGSPLHASRSSESERTGGSTLFVVTQSDRRQTCLASAVDDETGALRWQRQIGLVALGDPLLFPARGGPPLVLLHDQSGALIGLDPSDYGPGRPGGFSRLPSQKDTLLGQPVDDGPVPSRLLPGPEPGTAFAISSPTPRDGVCELFVRRVGLVPGTRRFLGREGRMLLKAPLAGTPAVVGTHVIAPLSNGKLALTAWPLADTVRTAGPKSLVYVDQVAAWRVATKRITSDADEAPPRQPPADARGHVLAVGKDRFVVTNGAEELALLKLPARESTDELHRHHLDARIVGAPVLISDGPGGPHFAVADAGKKLHLFKVEGDRLKAVNSWPLKAVPAAGPFRRALEDGTVKIGCVLEGGRLAWVGPDDREALEPQLGSGLVGEPQLAEGVLVVADVSGRYRAHDPYTLSPLGPGHLLSGSVAPAACPVSFGPGRLMAPLTDGTAVLLPLGLLHPLRHFPTAW
jgi:hypothetical protein